MKRANTSLSGPCIHFPVSAMFLLWVFISGSTSSISISETPGFQFLMGGMSLDSLLPPPSINPTLPLSLLSPPTGTEWRCHLVVVPGTAPGATDPEWLNSKQAVQQQSELLNCPYSPCRRLLPHPVPPCRVPTFSYLQNGNMMLPTFQNSKIEISPAIYLAPCRIQ